MRRIIDRYPRHEHIRLMIGEGGVFAQPSVVTTVLGSCVSVTFFCPAKKIGAIFHAILPVMPEEERKKPLKEKYTYVDESVRRIVHSLQKRGIGQSQIEVKVFGGAQAVANHVMQPGTNNLMTAYEVLAAYNLKIVASDVGGDKGRNLVFISNTGEVYVKNHTNNIVDMMRKRAEPHRPDFFIKAAGER